MYVKLEMRRMRDNQSKYGNVDVHRSSPPENNNYKTYGAANLNIIIILKIKLIFYVLLILKMYKYNNRNH
jgi:hypothetical protein